MGGKLSDFFSKAKEFITKHAGAFCILTLVLFCYLFLYLNLGAYRLVDFGETKFANISRAMLLSGNFITPCLNFDPFLDVPPLNYWLMVLAYKLTGSTEAFATRLPAAVLSTVLVFATYFYAKKVLGSKIYGLVSSLILLSSFAFLTFSRLATLDIGFVTFVTLSIYFASIPLFDVKEENKKYMLYASSLFLGLGAIYTGLLAVTVPLIVIIFSYFALGRIKDLIKPSNIIPSIIIFFLVTLPWYILVFKTNGSAVDYLVIKYHFIGFIASQTGFVKKQPLLYYVPVLFFGFMPWICSFVSAVIRGIKSLIKDFKATKSLKQIFSNDTKDRKLLIFASIWFVAILLFLSLTPLKTPGRLLALFPAISLITGYYWWGYIVDNKFEKGIKISTVVNASILIIIGIILALSVYAVILKAFVTSDILMYIQNADAFRLFIASWLIIVSLITILCIISKNRSLLFVANVILMTGVSIILSAKVLSYASSLDQAELESYADAAQTVSSSRLATFGFDEKYSLLNNYKGKVIYISNSDNQGYKTLNDLLKQAKKENTLLYLIVKKDVEYPVFILKQFKKQSAGQVYDLYVTD